MVVPSRYHSPMKRDNPLTNIQSYTCARLSENRISHSVLCLKKTIKNYCCPLKLFEPKN